MRRLIAAGAIALLTLAAVPLANAVVAPPGVSKVVEGSVKVYEPNWGGREWLARFEVRTTSGAVNFGYLELYGVTPDNNAGQIHEFSVNSVDYFTTPSGAPAATLHMEECIILGDPDADTGIPTSPGCFDGVDVAYKVSDGSPDTFQAQAGPAWTVESGNISIREVPADTPVIRVGRAKVLAGHRYVDVDLRSKGGLGPSPRCFAELQKYRSGVWVTACRPNYPVTGKARIYLNKAVSKATYVAWEVANS